MDLDLIRSLAVPGTTKIVLLSADGLGGFPDPATGLSELETARIPHLDALARRGACGLLRHVAPGITPGSGPGHLGLFGYEPLRYPVGRGVLEALGIDFDLRPGDVAARGNFCTLDAEGRITDRRAGRIPTERCAALVDRLRRIRVPGVELLVEPVKEHRFVLVLRGPGLSGRLSETDPQALGQPPLPVQRAGPRGAGHRGPGQPVRGGGPGPPRRRRARQHGAAARLRPAAGPSAVPGGVRAPGRRDRRLPHVPGARAPGRHGRAQDGQHVRGRGDHAARPLGRLRLRVPPLQGHRQGRGGRGLPGQGGGARAAGRRAPGDRGARPRTSSSSAGTTRAPPSSAATPGTRFPSCWRAGTRCPTRWSDSRSGPAGRAASAPCPPTTSCRSSSPTPCASPSTAPDRRAWTGV